MRLDSILVAACELTAFASWAVNFKKFRELKNKLFTVYLSIIVVTELANIFFATSINSLYNIIVTHFNVPMQFIFLFYFLVYKPKKINRVIVILFTAIYLAFFITERLNFFVRPANFDSLSYGVGCLLLISSILIAIINIFKFDDPLAYNQNTLFWIIMGLIIYYIGSFPYQNFRNFLWSHDSYTNTTYLLHYLSQTFNCIMYLLFAYAVKWKLN